MNLLPLVLKSGFVADAMRGAKCPQKSTFGECGSMNLLPLVLKSDFVADALQKTRRLEKSISGVNGKRMCQVAGKKGFVAAAATQNICYQNQAKTILKLYWLSEVRYCVVTECEACLAKGLLLGSSGICSELVYLSFRGNEESLFLGGRDSSFLSE